MTGRFEVYLRPYPGPGIETRLSVNGGSNLVWNPNGRELFFIEPGPDRQRKMMSVDVQLGSSVQVGRSRQLFEFQLGTLLFGCSALCYSVAPDGQHFYVTRNLDPPPPPVVTQINLIQNWFEELKAKVGGGQ